MDGVSARCGVAGMGLVFCRGRGQDALVRATVEGVVAPSRVSAAHDPSGTAPAFPVDLPALADKPLLARLRRADRLSLLTAIAASDAFHDAALAPPANERTGIIVATALGPHVTTFRFLEEILTYGDARPSALAFSHSVHNTAASYVATLLDLRGPAVTIAQTEHAFHQALLLAESWLVEGRCDHVLVGAVEELGEVLRYVCETKCPTPADGRLRPFSFRAQTVPGEASVFFVLRRGGDGVRVRVSFGVDLPDEGCDLLLLDADGMSGGEAAYGRLRPPPGTLCASYLALCGGMLTGSAFHAALGAWMVGHRRALPPADVRPGTEDTAFDPRHVACVKLNCDGEAALLELFAPRAPAPGTPRSPEADQP